MTAHNLSSLTEEQVGNSDILHIYCAQFWRYFQVRLCLYETISVEVDSVTCLAHIISAEFLSPIWHSVTACCRLLSISFIIRYDFLLSGGWINQWRTDIHNNFKLHYLPVIVDRLYTYFSFTYWNIFPLIHCRSALIYFTNLHSNWARNEFFNN